MDSKLGWSREDHDKEEAMTQTKPEENTLPWQFYQHSVSKLWSVRTADHERIAFDLDESTARLIVTAVNSHAELVEALKAFIVDLKSDEMCGWCGYGSHSHNQVCRVGRAEAALKKAGAL